MPKLQMNKSECKNTSNTVNQRDITPLESITPIVMGRNLRQRSQKNDYKYVQINQRRHKQIPL